MARSQANSPFLLAGKRVFVAGHNGMVGSAIMRRLRSEQCEILTASRAELDLTRQAAVERWFAANKVEVVILAAAKVGGIQANDEQPADFLYENIAIEANVIHSAYQTRVAKLVFLGSSCIYPKYAAQPISEDALLSGELEPTNQWYAVAKVAGLKMCEAYRIQHGCDFISAMPTNLYGPGDNFDLRTSHVLPALIRKAHEAKIAGSPEMTVWGTGKPMREFLYVDDAADAIVHLAKHYSERSHVNVGCGHDLSIRDLAETVCRVVGYAGKLVFDSSKPDGTPRKLLDVSKLFATGWRPKIDLETGIEQTYKSYLAETSADR